MNVNLNLRFGRFLKAHLKGKVVEIVGLRNEGLLKETIKNFGEKALFISTYGRLILHIYGWSESSYISQS